MQDINRKTVHLHTLGCKLNYAETSMLSTGFEERGYHFVDINEHPDVFVLNTCSVTDNADKECRQLIRSVLSKYPETYVIITGCYAQLQPHEIAAIHGVDLVLGSSEKFKLFDYIDNFEKKNYSCIYTSPVEEAADVNFAYTADNDSRTRAFLKIQDGCDYNCSFCTIPLARGMSRSLDIKLIIENAEKLIASGYREIVLTGVNTGDYNYDGKKLIDVLYELDKLDIERIRISSIEPNLLNDDIIALVKSSEKFCNHFHIPLQSGDDNVLKLMKRRYMRGVYHDLVHKLNENIPGIGIGVDVITGFPGETNEQFENTCKFIDDLNISYLHVFSYSERRNTKASNMPGKVDIAERKRRSKILRELSNKKRIAFFHRNSGSVHNVLFETVKEDGKIYGFTENYIKTTLNGSNKNYNLKDLENKIMKVKLIKANGYHHCIGDVL